MALRQLACSNSANVTTLTASTLTCLSQAIEEIVRGRSWIPERSQKGFVCHYE